MIEGKSLQQAAALTREQLVDTLGGLTSASLHASHLAIDTLHRVLEKIK
jgi:NifU-like protein involved in Fe-S cluster formation